MRFNPNDYRAILCLGGCYKVSVQYFTPTFKHQNPQRTCTTYTCNLHDFYVE